VTGKNFTQYLKKQKPFKKIAFSEIHRTQGLIAGNWFISARTINEKAIYSPKQEKYSAFNLRIDPKEKNPIQGSQHKKVDYLKKSIEDWRKVFGSTEDRVKLQSDFKEALRSLGYIQ
jgi:hypothetical protein